MMLASIALTGSVSLVLRTHPLGIKGPSGVSETARKIQDCLTPHEELEQYKRYSLPTFPRLSQCNRSLERLQMAPVL